MTQPQSKVDTFFRFAIGVYLFSLVLLLYGGTSDPTIDPKYLLTSWIAGLLAGGYLVVATLLRRPLRRPPIFFSVVLALLGFFFVSALLSDYRVISLHETARFFSLFALYWLATQVYATPAQVLRLFAIFCAAVAIAAVYAVMQAAGLDPYPWTDTTSDVYTNLPATYGNPNFAAHALILAGIMAIALARSGARWVLWIAPLLLFHFYSTDQRAGWIALAGAALLVGLAALLFRGAGRPVARSATALVLFGLIGVAGLAAAMAITHARTGHYFPLDLSLLLRYQSYVSATRMIFDAPVLGHGPAVYGLAYAPYWTPFEQAWFAQELLMNQHVHNDLLEIAIDGGLAAAGLYLFMLILGMGYGLLLAARGTTPLHRRLGYTFAALFCAFAIDGLFGFNLRVPVTAAVFFLMMGTLDGLWSRAGSAPEVRRVPALGFSARCAFLVVLLAALWMETRSFASEYHLHAGVRAQKAGEMDRAIASYQRAGALAPWNWNCDRRLGLAELDRDRVPEALAALERSLEKNPHYVLTYLPMARANLMLAQQAVSPRGPGAAEAVNRLDEARRNAEAVLAVVPGFFAASDVLARVESIAAIINRDHGNPPDPAVQAKHWESARLHLREAIDQGPEEAGELYRMLVQVETSLGDLDGAEQALIAAVQAEPGERRTWSLFMNFARQHKRYDRMRGLLFQQIDGLLAIENRSESESIQLAALHQWLAVLLDEGFGDVQGALDAFAAAVAHGPRRPEAWARFAALAAKHDRTPDFIAALRTGAARIREQGGTPLPQVAAVDTVETDASQLDGAGRILLAGVRAFPRNEELSVQEAYGWAVGMLLQRYDALAQTNSAPCESALNLGVCAASLDDPALAERLLQTALACLQGELRAAAAVHYADILVRSGEGDQALELLKDLEAQFPGNLELRWAQARALVALRRLDQARTLYRGLLEDSAVPGEARALLERELAALNDAA